MPKKKHLSSPVFFCCAVRVFHLFSCVFWCAVLLCVFTFWVRYCDVLYDVRIKTIFGSFLSPDVCRKAHVIYSLCVFIADRCVQHILCCVFVFAYTMLPVSLDCPFLIATQTFVKSKRSNRGVNIYKIYTTSLIYVCIKCKSALLNKNTKDPDHKHHENVVFVAIFNYRSSYECLWWMRTNYTKIIDNDNLNRDNNHAVSCVN